MVISTSHEIDWLVSDHNFKLQIYYSRDWNIYSTGVGKKNDRQEEFEDTKGVIRIHISQTNIQHNRQTKQYKRTNNDLQNIHIKRYLSLESLSKITILSIKLVQEPTMLFHYTLTCTKTTKRQTMIYNTLHSELEIEQSEPL